MSKSRSAKLRARRLALRPMFKAASQVTGVPIQVLEAVAKQESGFNPKARSPVGARGIMQLMPGTAKDLGVNPDIPMQNVLGGAKYLKTQFEKFGRWDHALAAYNAGPGNVSKYKGIPPFKETQGYVKNIMADLNRGLQIQQRQQFKSDSSSFLEALDSGIASGEIELPEPEQAIAPNGEEIGVVDSLEETPEIPQDIQPSTSSDDFFSALDADIDSGAIDISVQEPEEITTPTPTELTPQDSIENNTTLGVLDGLSSGSGLDMVTNFLDDKFGISEKGAELQAGLVNTLNENEGAIKSGMVGLLDSLGLGDHVHPDVKSQVEFQEFPEHETVTAENILENQEEADAVQELARENSGLVGDAGELAGFLLGPGKVIGTAAKGVKAGSKAGQIAKLLGLGATEGAAFEGITNEDADLESIATAGALGAGTAGAVKLAGKALQGLAAPAKSVVNRFLNTKNPKLAEQFLEEKAFKFASSKKSLLKTAENIIQEQDDKLTEALKAFKTKINIGEILEKEALTKGTSLNRFLNDATQVNNTSKMKAYKEMVEKHDKIVSLSDANKVKQLFWKEAKYNKNGEKSVAAAAQTFGQMGAILRDVIHKAAPGKNINEINRRMGLGLNVVGHLDKSLQGSKRFGDALTAGQMFKDIAVATSIGGAGAGKAAAIAGQILQTTPGTTLSASALKSLSEMAKKFPERIPLINALFPQVKDILPEAKK